MATTGNETGFQRALTRFKSHLSPAEQEKFHVTRLEDVQETIAHIQASQGSERKMRNLTRIRAFVEAMEQYGKVVEVFVNVSDIIAFVWVCGESPVQQRMSQLTGGMGQGPIKFLLQVP